MQKLNTYKLPASGEARENLRKKGQFWTPDWVAEAMVEYVFKDRGGALFDPAVGAGAFFRAAKIVAQEHNLPYLLLGMDIDPNILDEATQHGLSKDDLKNVQIGDFIFQTPQKKLSAIVANPPYIRHHRISLKTKEKLKKLCVENAGILGLSGVQLGQHFIAADAQCFGGGIQVEAVAAFVLYFGQQDQFGAQGWRARHPVAFGLHPDYFRVGMLADLSDEVCPVAIGHGVARFDFLVAGNFGFKKFGLGFGKHCHNASVWCISPKGLPNLKKP